MRDTGFTLRTRWRLAATIAEVAEVLADPERLPDWWSAVYLSVVVVAPGDGAGIGRTVAFHTRGWLPYTLRWRGTVVAADPPHGWTIEAEGDLAGRGVWRLAQEGALAVVDYDWRVRVEKPGLKLLTPLLRPVYAANHRWAMARGREGIERELVRRRSPGTGAR